MPGIDDEKLFTLRTVEDTFRIHDFVEQNDPKSAVVVGGAIAGVAGMFFVIPVVSVIYVLLREHVQKRNAERDALEAAAEKTE